MDSWQYAGIIVFALIIVAVAAAASSSRRPVRHNDALPMADAALRGAGEMLAIAVNDLQRLTLDGQAAHARAALDAVNMARSRIRKARAL